jgi:hypothetical protein
LLCAAAALVVQRIGPGLVFHKRLNGDAECETVLRSTGAKAAPGRVRVYATVSCEVAPRERRVSDEKIEGEKTSSRPKAEVDRNVSVGPKQSFKE